MRPTLAAVLSTSMILTACGSPSANVMGAAPSTGCHAAGAQALLGQRLDDMVLQDALRDSGALRTRVLPPVSAAVAGNADPMRLNLELDAQGRIHRMVCG